MTISTIEQSFDPVVQHADRLDAAHAQLQAPLQLAHPVRQIQAWANDYENIGGHGLIVQMLRSYAALRTAQLAQLNPPSAVETAATNAQDTKLSLTQNEQQAVLDDPSGILVLMAHHECKEVEMDAFGGDSTGHKLRHDQLKAHGAAIINADPDIWPVELVKSFDVNVEKGESNSPRPAYP